MRSAIDPALGCEMRACPEDDAVVGSGEDRLGLGALRGRKTLDAQGEIPENERGAAWLEGCERPVSCCDPGRA